MEIKPCYCGNENLNISCPNCGANHLIDEWNKNYPFAHNPAAEDNFLGIKIIERKDCPDGTWLLVPHGHPLSAPIDNPKWPEMHNHLNSCSGNKKECSGLCDCGATDANNMRTACIAAFEEWRKK